MAFTDFLNPVFDPLLKLHPGLAIFIIALIITLLITVVYKYTTDQKKMKKLKDDIKESQKKMKEMSKTSPEKALKMQSEAMKMNFEYMKSSFKSTFYTLIPVLFIFAWLSVNLAYYPITPNHEFTVTAYFADGHAEAATLSAIPDLTIISNSTQKIQKDAAGKENVAIWRLKGTAGDYRLMLDYNGEKYDQPLLITSARKYAAPEKLFQNSKLQKMVIGNQKVYAFSLFGLNVTWFWAYFIFSIVLSILLRKIMKVY